MESEGIPGYTEEEVKKIVQGGPKDGNKTNLFLYILFIIIPSSILILISSKYMNPVFYGLESKAILIFAVSSFVLGIVFSIIFFYIEKDKNNFLLAGAITSLIAGIGNFIITAFAKSKFLKLVEQGVMRIPPEIGSVDKMVPNPWIVFIIIVVAFNISFLIFYIFKFRK